MISVKDVSAVQKLTHHQPISSSSSKEQPSAKHLTPLPVSPLFRHKSSDTRPLNTEKQINGKSVFVDNF